VQTVDVPYTTNRELFAAETDVFAVLPKKRPPCRSAICAR
jgi:hypothetical protein